MKNTLLFLLLVFFVSILGISTEAFAWEKIDSFSSSRSYSLFRAKKYDKIHLGNYTKFGFDELETIQQSQTSSPDFNTLFWSAMIGTVFQVIFVGVIASSISGKDLFKWGLAGVIAGGIGALLGFIAFFALPTLATLAVSLLAQSVFMLLYGIDNLIKNGKRRPFSPDSRNSDYSRRRNYIALPIFRF